MSKVVAADGWDRYLRPDHVLDLTDDTGIWQHANGIVPAWEHGYCVDDVARLVVVGCGLWRRTQGRDAWQMVVTGLAFLEAATATAASGQVGMRNFMAADRTWLDEPHFGDHVGRTVWALGEVLQTFDALPALEVPARLHLHRLLAFTGEKASPHHSAYWMVGLSRALAEHECDECRSALETMVAQLDVHWAEHASDDWPWPLERLSYDNARFPQALLLAGEVLQRPDLTDRGRHLLDWLVGIMWKADRVHSVGNEWLHPGERNVGYTGDEQPIDIASLCECLTEAVRLLGDDPWADRAQQAFAWFLGANRLGVPLYDPVTAGCHDGLGAETVNFNQGAESTLAFLQAALALSGAGLPAPDQLSARN